MKEIEFKGKRFEYDETIVSKWSFQHKALKASQGEFMHLMADELFDDPYAVAERLDDDNVAMNELILAICEELNESAKN